MTSVFDRELPYEGTFQGLRLQAAEDGHRGQTSHGRIMAEFRSHPDQHAPEEVSEQMLNAISAAGYGWGLVAVLGWLAAEHGDLAYQAACIVQDVQINGGNRWCEDIPYPPQEGNSR